jgi:methyl-accepting chemotaxis protein
MGFLRRLDSHMARGNELFDRGNELMELNREAMDRNTRAFEDNREAFKRHGEAIQDLRNVIHWSIHQGERQTDRLVEALNDLRSESQAHTQAILRLLDRFDSTGGPEIEPA